MEDLVSVIVPVYNVEKYLKSSLESILNQTYKKLDIILVNDGSTDNSKSICEEYVQKDSRVRLINKENGGNGDARNVGLQQVKGEWIVWVDSDDMIHKRQIEILLSVAKDNNADIVVGDYITIEDDELPQDSDIDEEYVKSCEILSEKHLYDDEFIKRRSMIFTTPWCKLVKRDAFNNIKYPTKIRHVDTWTTWKTYENVEHVVFVSVPLYYWRINPNSLTRNTFDNSQFTMLDAYIEQFEYFIKKRKQRYVEIVFSEYIETFFWCYNRMNEIGLNYSELKPYLLYMRNHIKYIKYTKSIGFWLWLKYRYLVYYKIPKLLK